MVCHSVVEISYLFAADKKKKKTFDKKQNASIKNNRQLPFTAFDFLEASKEIKAILLPVKYLTLLFVVL